MSEQPESRALRASNDDRERVAQVLHDAMAQGRITLDELDERLQATYAAKTLDELTPITQDLPGTSPVLAAAQHPAVMLSKQHITRQGQTGVQRIAGTPDATLSIGVFGGFERKGSWVVPPTHNVVCIFGGGTIDMSEAHFAQQESVLNVFAWMGGAEIKVPSDVTVHVEGVGILGGFSHDSSTQPQPGAPVVRVRGLAIFGGISVERISRKRLES
ncbi:MAG: DUF1707 SHOCT-like domain-containing protein [Sciscionella sp.]